MLLHTVSVLSCISEGHLDCRALNVNCCRTFVGLQSESAHVKRWFQTQAFGEIATPSSTFSAQF